MWSVLTGIYEEQPWRSLYLPAAKQRSGTTYAQQLVGLPVEKSLEPLRDLVIECMSADPNHRPMLGRLYYACRKNDVTAKRVGHAERRMLTAWARAAFKAPLQRALYLDTTETHMSSTRGRSTCGRSAIRRRLQYSESERRVSMLIRRPE